MPCSASPSVLSFHAQSRRPGLFSRARRWLGGLLALSSLAVACAGADYWNADTTFAPALEGNTGTGSVAYAYGYTGGKVLVTTSAGIINGKVITSWLTRLNADGSIDSSLVAPAPYGQILAVYPDGKILYGTSTNSSSASLLVQRMLGNGSADSTFTPIVVGYNFFNVRLLADERILLFGSFTTVGGVTRVGVARLNTDGTLDTGFQSPFPNNGFSPTIQDVVPANDGDFYMVGSLAGMPAGQSWVARLNADGSPDNAFNIGNTSISGLPSRAYPQADGGVVMVDAYGNFQRFNATGGLDTAFSVSLPDSPRTFGRANADGKIYYLSNPYSAVALRRMNADFTDDTTFTPISTPYAASYGVGLPSVGFSGELYLGALTAERMAARFEISRVSATGTLDPSFNPRFSRPVNVNAHLRQPDGKELIAGPFTYVNNTATTGAYNVVRLLADGSLDSGFSAPLPNGTSINRLALQPDGKILAFGWFPQPDGRYFHVRRFAADGAIDTSYEEITDNLNYPAVDANGGVYAIRSGSVNRLEHLLANGQTDYSFLAPADATSARFIVPLPDGKVLLAQSVSGSNYTLKRLLANGTADPAFTPIPIGSLISLVGFPDGSVLVCTGSSNLLGAMLVMRRLPAGATSSGTLVDNFSYTTRTWTNSVADSDIQMTIGGVLLDLLREASPGVTASVQADFSTNNIRKIYDCRSDGQLMVTDQPDMGFGGYLQRYLRADSTTPSFDPTPVIQSLTPTSALLRPLNYRQPLSVSVSGLGPFTYQWLKDGNPVPGVANSAVVFLPPIQESDGGTYSVSVTNAHNTVTSAGITLTVDTAHATPAITTHPTSRTVLEDSSTTFTVIADGNPSPSYQWYFNSNPISGATSASFTIAKVRPEDAGNYSVTVYNTVVNGGGNFSWSVGSTAATLTVTPLAVISNLTSPRQVLSDGQPLALSVTAAGTGTCTFQWFHNGKAIPGATTDGYNIPSSRIQDNGWYVVDVTDANGTRRCAPIFVTVAPTATQVRAWGVNTYNTLTAPAGLNDAIALDGGFSHALALRRNGTVVGWGSNSYGETTVPGGLNDAVAVSASGGSYALRSNGTVVGWGLYASPVPAGLVDVVSISDGGNFTLALRSNGAVVAWGTGSSGQLNIPAGLTGVTAIAAGGAHALALKSDGTVAAWGSNLEGQTNVPAGLADVVAIAASNNASFAVRSDGTVVYWGNEPYTHFTVPAGLNHVFKLSAHWSHAVSLKDDGSVVAWGLYPPARTVPTDLGVCVDVATGTDYSLALVAAGTAPSISQQPVSQSITEGEVATFTLTATGTPTPSYQWQSLARGSSTWQNMGDGGNFTGSLAATLQVSDWTVIGSGNQFRCVVTNSAGSVTSDAVTLTVTRPRSVPGDIDGDRTSDVVWRYAPNGSIASWTSSGGYRNLGTEDANWKAIGSGDFDGDGMTDMLWRYVPAGLVASWTSSWGYLSLGTEDANWKIVGTGDFDGDGYFEALWRYVPTGLIASWTSTAGYMNLGTEDTNWKAISTGDFDGDGHSDVLWRYGPSGLIATWTTAGTYVNIGTEDTNWRFVGTGDYDGDGTTDVLWRYAPTGAIGSWTSSAGYRSMGTEGSGWTAVGN